MELKRDYFYGKCESCKNCKIKKIGGFVVVFICRKDNKWKKWNNKCHLYKTRRTLVKGSDTFC